MKNALPKKRRSAESGFWFVLPSVIILGGFGLAVTAANLWYSLQSWSALSAPKFAGLKNYQRFFSDAIALRSLSNTLQYALMYVFPTIVLSLLLAMMLNHKGKLMSFFRSLYYVPVITSYVVVIVVWQWFFDYDIGLFNSILGSFGIAKAPWLLDPNWAMPSLVLLSIWKNCGYTVLMFMAGLQTVDTNLYEAAAIDGSGRLSTFWHITLPQIKPTTTLCVVMVTTWSFQMFVQPYLLTKGGPDYSTMTVTYYLYQQAFSSYNIGYGSAIAVVSVAIFLLITTLEKRILRERG
ncbi:MAG: sugar ABC transporter permease [Eubacteriales bacterium]|nr:sugar ABC transporter permease [Eubacteriales bacterium]